MEEPIVPPIPYPRDHLRSAYEYLGSQGFTPREVVPLRSSSLQTAISDPFLFYLTNKLCMVPMTNASEALVYGSWFHALFESLDKAPFEAVSSFGAIRLAARLSELETQMGQWGASSEEIGAAKEFETESYKKALTMFQCVTNIPFYVSFLGTRVTLREFISRFRILASEFELTYTDPAHPTVPIVAVYDLLLYEEQSKGVWIMDPKTTSKTAKERLAQVPTDFQTTLYPDVLNKQFEFVREKFSLPKDAFFGGMIHVALQKPTIRFDKRVDRPFVWEQHTITRGPRKGMIDLKKNYTSDVPSLEIFLERLKRWYAATEEYADERPEREAFPVIDLSFSSAPYCLEGLAYIHQPRMEYLFEMCERAPYPGLYLKNPGPDLPLFYRLFYHTPYDRWTDIARQYRLVRHPRPFGDSNE